MTFGINTLDWTNIGHKLRTSLAETIGETLSSAVTESVLSPFAYYDGATGTVITTYSAYLDTTSNPPDIVTVKTDEDGANVVVDITPLTLLYDAVDAEGNAIITSDANAEGVAYDEQGMAISLSPSSAEYSDNLQTVYQTAIDTDTSWAPDLIMKKEELPGSDWQTVSEVTNSDGTSWLRLRVPNGMESIYYSIPYTNETEYNTVIDSIPDTFTFVDDHYLFPIGTVITPESAESGSASTVEATSLAPTLLSSTYDTSLDDLNTAYEAVLSGETITVAPAPCLDKPNSILNTTTGDCDCDSGYEENDSGVCVAEITNSEKLGVWFSSINVKVKQLVSDNIIWVGLTTVVLVGGYGAFWYMGRKTPKTVGEELDRALGTGRGTGSGN